MGVTLRSESEDRRQMALFSGVSGTILIGGLVCGLMGICLESVTFGVPLGGMGLGGNVSSLLVAFESAAIIVEDELDSFLEKRILNQF